MSILIDYFVDENFYYDPAEKHKIPLITVEYIYKNDVLVYLRFNADINVRLNNILNYESKKETVLSNEQFFSKKVILSIVADTKRVNNMQIYCE